MFQWGKEWALKVYEGALRRACKFLLKKKLGEYILGDIDLTNIDVKGGHKIELKSLALNVDFLNRKLSQTSMLRVREGSISSIHVQLRDGKFHVEVDKLELVLRPCLSYGSHETGGTSNVNEKYDVSHDSEKGEDEVDKSAAYLENVHEGVKTVAKMIERLLSSFHIKLKTLIVALEASVQEDGEKDASHQKLVLRVTEIECGSENTYSSDDAAAEDLLGMTHLTNFLKFTGAAVEILKLSSNCDSSVAKSGSGNTLLNGKNGGFCGSVLLSIPWKNGSLDIGKVNAEVKMDPLIARLQPSTLKWILATLEMLQNNDNKKTGSDHDMSVETLLPSTTPLTKKTPGTENANDFGSPLIQGTGTDLLFKEACFISDWVPSSTASCQNDGIEGADLGASVDQFFECFDGMRSCHSAMGSSGMWGWTSSLFSAVTAASNLGSGSLNYPAGQQHVQTNLNVTLAGVSVFFSFLDEGPLAQLGPTDDQNETDIDVHHLGLIWEDIVVTVEVCPQDWKLEATVGHIVLNDYLTQKGITPELFYDHLNCGAVQTLLIRSLQDKVQRSLPLSSLFHEASNVKDSSACTNSDPPFSLSDPEICEGRRGIVTATLFETSGAGHCLYTSSSRSPDGYSMVQASLTLKLPQSILWLSFDLMNVVSEFLRKFENVLGKNDIHADFSTESLEEKPEHSAHSGMKWSNNLVTSTASNTGSFSGNIFLPHARIILCFPSSQDKGVKSYTSWNHFIALEFSHVLSTKRSGEDTYLKQDSLSPSNSVHLNVASLEVFLITSNLIDGCGTQLESWAFCAHRILCLRNKTDWIRLVSVHWNENAVTGAWIVKSAKLFAMADGSVINKSSSASSSKFSSVSTREEMEDLSSLKQKLMLSSKLCIRVCPPSVVVTLGRSQYLCLFDLLNQATNALSVIHNVADNKKQLKSVSQTSILVECGEVEILMNLDYGDCPKSSLQRELPGSWHSLILKVQNLQLVSVSNIGAVSGAHFIWISHREGKMLGSILSGADRNYLLISCSSSSNGRGDGAGSNVLSTRSAGSDFVYMSDPENFECFMSIVSKCGTIVAPGGRLDWLDKISSFFSLPCPEVGQREDCSLRNVESQRLSFILKFIDGALSYEPRFGFVSLVETPPNEPFVACLLAASSFTLSSTTMPGSLINEYTIRLQDVGLLLREVSLHGNVLGEYNVSRLREAGFVKVAGEAVLDATLCINSEDDITWELQCSDSHIVLRTCHDTTSGLIRLVSQIQQLFAPDIEESLVHLQNRWNTFQHAQGVSESSSLCSPMESQVQELFPDLKDNSVLPSLMSEICEDAFLFCGDSAGPCDESQQITVGRRDEGPSSTDTNSGKVFDGGHTSVLHESEIFEGYCLSDLRSLSDLTVKGHAGEEFCKSDLVRGGSLDVQRGNSGWYAKSPLRIVENYVRDKAAQTCLNDSLEGRQCDKECHDSRRCKGRLRVQNVEVKWQMYGGSDWLELGQSGNICGRDENECLEVELSNLNIQYDLFPDGSMCASKLSVSVQDFQLYDQSRKAPWKLVLGYYHSKEHPRESLSNALKLDLEAVKPDPLTPLEEYRLRVAVLPVLLHLHQRQLDFLVAFFGHKSSLVEQQGDPLDFDLSHISSGRDDKSKGISIAEEALLPFFQKFDVRNMIVRVDYRPSRVDLAALSGGNYVELVNLVPWKGVELQLKHVQAAGIYGWNNVFEIAIGEWLEDISQNQIHKLLRGLPPIGSLVTVGSGAAKLVSLPVKNYRKDYRLVKGLQRGTIAFLRSISVEALGLGVHLAAGAQDILLHAECLLAHIQPSLPRPVKSKRKINLGPDQPQDAQHGLKQAYESLSDGLGKSASALIRTPVKTYQRGGSAGSAFVAAVRGAPAAAIAPASAAVQALHCALVGVRNSLDPQRKEESMKKYLGPSRSFKR